MNWTPINQVISEMKHKQELDGETLLMQVHTHLRSVEFMHSRGWPETEIGGEATGSLMGIPIELANIVKLVFQFSADHGIDLVEALEADQSALAS